MKSTFVAFDKHIYLQKQGVWIARWHRGVRTYAHQLPTLINSTDFHHFCYGGARSYSGSIETNFLAKQIRDFSLLALKATTTPTCRAGHLTRLPEQKLHRARTRLTRCAAKKTWIMSTERQVPPRKPHWTPKIPWTSSRRPRKTSTPLPRTDRSWPQSQTPRQMTRTEAMWDITMSLRAPQKGQKAGAHS